MIENAEHAPEQDKSFDSDSDGIKTLKTTEKFHVALDVLWDSYIVQKWQMSHITYVYLSRLMSELL